MQQKQNKTKKMVSVSDDVNLLLYSEFGEFAACVGRFQN